MDRIGLSINTRSETSDEELIAIAKLRRARLPLILGRGIVGT